MAVASSMTTATTSRLVRAVHYEPANKRLCVLTTHGRLEIYDEVPLGLAEFIAEHDYPGFAYQLAKEVLGPKRSQYNFRYYPTARRARQAIERMLVFQPLRDQAAAIDGVGHEPP